MKKSNKAAPVLVEFLDHNMVSGDQAAPADCTCLGFLVKQDKKALYLCTWSSDGEVDTCNSEYFVLVKHKGIRITYLKPIQRRTTRRKKR